MDELHKAALAYYNNGSEEQQRLAYQFFQAMDVDRNNRISLQEYIHFLSRTPGLDWVRQEMFQWLDRNGDGQLDFWEVLTLYYVARTRTNSCRSCCGFLNSLYFTCLTCFDTPYSDTFDLCLECYSQRRYSHPHRVFLDSYVLLRSRRNHNQPLQPLGDQNLAEQEEPWRLRWWHALTALEIGLSVGSLAAFCTIM